MSPEATPQKPVEIPPHFYEFIDSLKNIRWIMSPEKQPKSLSDNENFTFLFDIYQRSRNASGITYGDRWQEVKAEISTMMKLQLGEKEFKKRELAIRNQALFSTKSGSPVGSFDNDAALYYFYKNYNRQSPNFSYIESRWNIWLSGYGVAGERTCVGRTTFYCYKRIS